MKTLSLSLFKNSISLFSNLFIMLSMTLMSHSALATAPNDITPLNDQNLILQDMQGEFRNLYDYAIKNKWLVVIIWQSDCHICNLEAEAYSTWFENNKNGDSALIGISTDGWQNKNAAQAFIDRHNVSYPNALISYQTLNQYYLHHTGKSFIATPSFLIYSPEGVLKIAQVGAVPTKLIDDYINKNKKQVNNNF